MVDYYEDRTSNTNFNIIEHMISLRDNDVSFKDWIVYKNGDMNTVDDNYPISKDRLTEEHWISHMRSKSWVDMNTFIDAYLFALLRSGHDHMRIKIHM